MGGTYEKKQIGDMVIATSNLTKVKHQDLLNFLLNNKNLWLGIELYAFFPFFCWWLAVTTTKRFHDIKLTGILIFLLACAISFLLYANMAVIALCIASLVFIICLLIPGTKGKNKYGEDPLSPPTEEKKEAQANSKRKK